MMEAIAAFRRGAAVALGIDHPHYPHRVERLPAAAMAALVRDFA